MIEPRRIQYSRRPEESGVVRIVGLNKSMQSSKSASLLNDKSLDYLDQSLNSPTGQNSFVTELNKSSYTLQSEVRKIQFRQSVQRTESPHYDRTRFRNPLSPEIF